MVRQTIFILMSSGVFMSPETGIYLHTDLHPSCESSHPSWALGALCSPQCSKTSSRACTWMGDAPPEYGRVAAGHCPADGPSSRILPLSAVSVPAALPGAGGWDGPGRHQEWFGFGTREHHHLPSLPPSLPQSVPRLLAFLHRSLMFCHRLPVGAGSRKCSCHSRRLSLLVFQLVSHKEMVKHNPLRAAGSRIEFFHLSPETALYSHTDKTNGLAGSDSDKAADGFGPTCVVSRVTGPDPRPGPGTALCLSPPCADACPGFSQLEIMFPDKYLIFKNEILITTPSFTVRL